MSIDRRAWVRAASRGMSADQYEALTRMVQEYFALPGVAERGAAADQHADREDVATLEAIAKTIRQDGSLRQAAERARSAQIELTGWIRAAALFGEPEAMIARQTGMMRLTIKRRLTGWKRVSEAPDGPTTSGMPRD